MSHHPKLLAPVLALGLCLCSGQVGAATPEQTAPAADAPSSVAPPTSPDREARSAAVSDRPVLYLGVQWLGKPLKLARVLIQQRLRDLHVPAKLADPELTREELTCRTPDCLQTIAKHQKVVRILGGHIVERENKLHVVTLWMFDLRLSGSPTSSVEYEERCEACNDDKLNDTIRRAVDGLLYKAGSVVSGAMATSGAPPPALTAPPPSPVSEERPAVVVTTEPVRLPRPPVVPNEPVVRPAPPVVAPPPVLEVAKAPPQVVPLQETSPPRADLAPLAVARSAPAEHHRFSYGRGVAVGLVSGLLVSVLGTTLALTALDQSGVRTLCQIPSGGASVECAPRAMIYGLGYGLSAALIGGLALTLALPGGKASSSTISSTTEVK